MMTMLINILIFFACVCISSQSNDCHVCIIDSTCDDSAIDFNISISQGCKSPLNIYYSYDTEIHSIKRYSNATIDCQDCYFEITVNVERDAWDYTLILESPRSADVCSVYTAHCGGEYSLTLWYITGGLSGLFIVLGVAVCIARCYRTNRQRKITQKKIQVAVIST